MCNALSYLSVLTCSPYDLAGFQTDLIRLAASLHSMTEIVHALLGIDSAMLLWKASTVLASWAALLQPMARDPNSLSAVFSHAPSKVMPV